MEKRFIGIDTARGFGIFAMIFIHSIIQQIAHYNAGLFIPTFASFPVFILIILSPLALLGVMGPFFVLLTTASATLQMVHLNEAHPEKMFSYIQKRIINGFFIIFISRSIYYLLGAHFFEMERLYFPPFQFYLKSETLDAIVWAGVIAPFILLLVLKWLKKPGV